MKPAEYLDACKKALHIGSDYELAHRLEVPKQYVSEYRKGRRMIAPDVAFRIAITLERDPAQVWAEIEVQQEKNEKRRDFWRSFLSRAATVAAVACTLALSYSAGLGNAPAASGGKGRLGPSASNLGLRRRLRFAV